MRYKFFFVIIVCFLISLSSHAQIYKCQYQIIADSGFLAQSSESGIRQQQYIQSSILRQFFDGMLINNIVDKEHELVRYIPKYLQEHHVEPGAEIPRNIIVGKHKSSFEGQDGSPEKVDFTIAPGAFDAFEIFDKKKMKIYYIRQHPDRKITSQAFSYHYTFRKTHQKKKIKKWLCYKWLATDKVIKNQVAIWVCDSIPKCITLAGFCDYCFDGGVVRVDFQRGFSYQLNDYVKEKKQQYLFPKISHCDSTIEKPYNFINQSVYQQIGLDFKYNFKSKQ